MNLTLVLLHFNLFHKLKMITKNFILMEARGIFRFLKKDHYADVSVPLSLDVILIMRLKLQYFKGNMK